MLSFVRQEGENIRDRAWLHSQIPGPMEIRLHHYLCQVEIPPSYATLATYIGGCQRGSPIPLQAQTMPPLSICDKGCPTVTNKALQLRVIHIRARGTSNLAHSYHTLTRGQHAHPASCVTPLDAEEFPFRAN